MMKIRNPLLEYGTSVMFQEMSLVYLKMISDPHKVGEQPVVRTEEIQTDSTQLRAKNMIFSMIYSLLLVEHVWSM